MPLAEELKARVRIAFAAKLKETEEYIDEMVENDEQGAQVTLKLDNGDEVQSIGLDAVHNVNEIIKDLEAL